MAQESANVRVKMPDGSNWTIPRASLLRAKARGAIEIQNTPATLPKEEGTLKKAARGAALGTFSGAGIPETMHPLKDLWAGMKESATHPPKWDPTGGALSAVLGIGKNLGTTGVDVLKDIGKADPRVGGKPGGLDVEKTSHDVASLITQLALLKGGKKAATTPLAESEVIRSGETVPPKIIRNITGTKYATEQAEAEAAKKTAEYAEKRARYDEKVAEAKAEHEAKMAKKVAEHEADVETTKAAHQAKMDAAEQSLAGKVTREAHARLKNTRLDAAKQKLTSYRDSLVKLLSDNLLKTKQAEEGTLDARYNDFKQKVLGVSKENPNGTLQSQLTPVGQAVIDAKHNILKGSRTNITIFNDIMGRLKELIEAPDGTVRPMEGQMIHTDQLRGYEKELGSALYEKSLPGDVKQAVGAVRDTIHNEVVGAIKDSVGQKAVDVYEKLSEDWSTYKRTWFDESRVNPLPRIRAMLEDPTVTREGIPVAERIAKIVKDEPGQSIVKILAGKKNFGGYPEIPARLMAIEKKLGGLDKFYEKLTVAKYPRFPKLEEPKPPEIEPFKNKREEPEAPEPFNRNQFIKDTLTGRLNTAGRWGSGMMLLRSIYDATHGNLAGAASSAEEIAAIQAIKSLLTSPKVIEYLSREAAP